MAKKDEKEFKLMIVELLESGETAVQVSKDYGLNELIFLQVKSLF